MHLRFVEELTQSEIGARIGVSQMQVSRILRGVLDRLRADVLADDVVADHARSGTGPAQRGSRCLTAAAWCARQG